MKRLKTLNITTQFVLAVGVLMLAANLVLGLVSLRKTTNALRSLVERNMLDIANTAAAQVDGDALASMTEEDVGGPEWSHIYKELSAFQNNAGIHFIYAVRQSGEDRFIFVVDPDPEEPAAFGEEIVLTEALRSAGQGVAAVDGMAVSDRWGSFYSVFSPVLDSAGNVAGVVGIDFDIEWYNAQSRSHTISMLVITALSLLVSVVVIFLISRRIQKRFRELDRDMSALSSDVGELTEELASKPGYVSSQGEAGTPVPESPESEGVSRRGDELERLGERISFMRKVMSRYLDFLHVRAYTDGLTGVGNVTAYQDVIHNLDARAAENQVSFSVAVCDLDNLKRVNDVHGHTCGNEIIRKVAEVLVKVFSPSSVFRIGGDEFSAVAENAGEEAMEEKLRTVRQMLEETAIRAEGEDVPISLSVGTATFRPGQDEAYRDVFNRADEAMYRMKDLHHRQMGPRYTRPTGE